MKNKNSLSLGSLAGLSLAIIFIMVSCNETQENKDAQTFENNDLSDSKEADKAFVSNYSRYINTAELFDLDQDTKAISEWSTRSSKENSLQKSVEFEFDFTNGSEKYYALNNLTEFKDSKDVDKGWELCENSFWSGILSQGIKKEDFSHYKNSKFHSLGDYSEYSEVPIGTKSLFIFHIKWNKLIIQYSQIIPPAKKDEFVKLVERNFKEIQKKYR